MRQFIRNLLQFLGTERRNWGFIRLLLVVLVLLGLVFTSAKVFTPTEQYPWILFTLQGLRFWIFPIAGFFAALLLAGHYVRDLYELPNVRLGMRYVVSTLFGFFLPTLRVEHGRIVSDPNRINLLEHIGGPGYLNIASGNLVLLENPAGPSNVYSAGFHFVSRREIIKEVMSLEDQHGYIESRKATTRDGIEVEVREIRYLYRLRPSRRQGNYIPRDPRSPFPFTMQAMRNFAYSRLVSPNGLTDLNQAMDFIVDSSIVDYINANRFNDITSPTWGTDPHPRLEIWNNIITRESIQERFRNLGMELLWVDIGHFDVSDDIWRWRVRTWGANWAGTALLQRTRGRVRRLTYDRLARAEGRADALELIINQLNDARLSGSSADNLRNLVLLYTAQILDELGHTREDLEARNAEPPSGLP